ncbi:MAG: endolytic transglycosylase MltG [Propionibacteriaceae bacterium]|jgi:UPF0755 protein|nr:endolytic transglycosylase MltG [Propionibacteriaceae bacterium]
MADRNGFSWISSEGARRAKSAVAVALSFVILLGGAGLVVWKGYSVYMSWRQREDYIGAGGSQVQIYIPPGSSNPRIADILVAADVIKDPSVFDDECAKMGDAAAIWAGTYNLKTHLPAKTALDMLLDRDANRVTIRWTVPEGTRLSQIEDLMINELGVTREEVDQARAAITADPAGNSLSAYANPAQPEGYFFPDTYMSEPHDALGAFRQMTGQFNNVAGEINLDAAAANVSAGLGITITPQQLVVVASIIEGEVNRSEYRPMVARSIYNRLLVGQALGVESAFRYGREIATGTPYDDEIQVADQHNPDLPYNFYMKSALPDTPIANPGRDALQAAANPTPGPWRWWITQNLFTGETEFYETEEAFNEGKLRFDQWCVDNGHPTGCS